MKLTMLLLVAQSYLNDPYIFGANGFHVENGAYYRAHDCSSYVLQVLREVGYIHDNIDRSSQMLYDHLINREDVAMVGGVMANAVLFFGRSTRKITHVGIAIDDTYIIHCASGDENTLSIKTAMRLNAKVKINKINYRNDLVAAIVLSK